MVKNEQTEDVFLTERGGGGRRPRGTAPPAVLQGPARCSLHKMAPGGAAPSGAEATKWRRADSEGRASGPLVPLQSPSRFEVFFPS